MPKVSFRMASAYRQWVFGVQTNTARKIHRSDHTEGRLSRVAPMQKAGSRSVKTSRVTPPRSSKHRTSAKAGRPSQVGGEPNRWRAAEAEDRDHGIELDHPVAERPQPHVRPVALGLSAGRSQPNCRSKAG